MSTDTQKLTNATVIGREDIHPQLTVMRVRPDEKLFEFKPGQFAVLGLPGSAARVASAETEFPVPPPDQLIRRAYSIASASVERRYVEFFITLINSGQLTPRLFALKHGDRIFLGPKASGVFTLDKVPAGKAVLLIATGTGLAPYVSMLRTYLAHETRRKIIVLHGARYSWDLGYRGELETLARLRPNFTYIPSITRPDQDQHFLGRIGRIQAVLSQGALEKDAGVPLDPKELDVYLCGNPEMIQVVTEMLATKGFKRGDSKNPGNIHVEEYW